MNSDVQMTDLRGLSCLDFFPGIQVALLVFVGGTSGRKAGLEFRRAQLFD